MVPAFVGGNPVRPSSRDGKLLLPLRREVASDSPLDVQLTYVGPSSFPRRQGHARFQFAELRHPYEERQVGSLSAPGLRIQ